MYALPNALLKILKHLVTILQKSIKSLPTEHTSALDSLAPKVLTDAEDIIRIKPYLDNLKNAIDTPGINNIAVTGSYGSGKSTIIKTFQHLNDDYQYLNISLASFKDNTDDTEGFERRLEISILQQMFYHVEPSVIPDSRFKRIVNVTTRKLFLLTAFLMVWLLGVLILFKFGYIEKINPSLWVINQQFDWIAFISSIIFFLGIGLFVKNVYRLLSNSKISKLNIKGELELGESLDKSVFNQHLEEILYFFERTNFNVIVIEDVDRFNSTDIFTKLREINILINNSNLINRPVKFVYAIKDEMFKDKNERVKFFEFIIPIIPFISPSNAKEQLSKMITKADLEGVLSTDFSSDVVTFIDDIDMRLLINIFHEYQIYKSVSSSSLNQDNLFAILVYKNIYPDDFGDLPKRKGKLYSFLNDKQTYLLEIKKKLGAEIEQYNNRIILLEKETISEIKELRAIYLYHLVAKLAGFHSLYVGKDVSLLDAAKDEFFTQIIGSADIKYSKVEYQSSYQRTHITMGVSSGIAFSSIEKDVNSVLSYKEREQVLLEKKENQTEVLKVDREKIKNRFDELDAMSIQEIFELIKIDKYLGNFKDSYLMRNLLLNGYIDEHYDDYISLFHEITITKEDFAFERSVKAGVGLPFDYQLSKTENVIKQLPQKYFRREVALNYCLCDILLKEDIKYKTKLDDIYKCLSIDGDKQFRFINGFIDNNGQNVAAFIKGLSAHKPGLWNYINTKSGLPEGDIRNLTKLIFENCTIDTILKFDNIKSLVTYLKDIPDVFGYLSTFKNVENIKAFISNKQIVFTHLDLPTLEQDDLFKFVYSGNHYKINEENIKLIITYSKIPYDAEQLSKAHFTTFMKLDLSHLKSYINDNLEQYISDVMLHIEGNTEEAEDALLELLNNSDIELELKEELLDSQSTVIKSITDIEEIDVKKIMFSHNKISPTWQNVFDYYDEVEGDEFDDILINFLNTSQNFAALANKKLTTVSDRDEDYIKKMSSKLLHNIHINLDAYSMLLSSLPYMYTSITYTDIDKERIIKLLDKNILALSASNFVGLKQKDSGLALRLVEIYQDSFVKHFSDSPLPLEMSDWLLIFKSPIVTTANKLALVQELDDSIIINNKDIADEVCNLLPEDKYIPVRYEVLNAMFKSHNSTPKRVALITLHSSNLDDMEVQSLSEELGEDYAKVFMKQHKPVFPNTKANQQFFTMLKDRNMIIRTEAENEGKSIRVLAKYQ